MSTVRVTVIAALAIAASTALAQQTTVSVGSLAHDTTLPVEVTSDNLSVANEAGTAVFEGNVVVVQGPMRLTAPRIEVKYTETADGGRTEIQRMHATGGVTYVNGTDAAESVEALYEPEAGTLVMTENVLLIQDKTAISGQKLTVDLDTGTGVMEGRVRTTFQTGNN